MPQLDQLAGSSVNESVPHFWFSVMNWLSALYACGSSPPVDAIITKHYQTPLPLHANAPNDGIPTICCTGGTIGLCLCGPDILMLTSTQYMDGPA